MARLVALFLFTALAGTAIAGGSAPSDSELNQQIAID